jgi:hypothetical protein
VETVVVPAIRLIEVLEDLREMPLDQIPSGLATSVVQALLDRDADQAPVDVATFSSAI